MIWKFIARICSFPLVAYWLINRSFKIPYTSIIGPDGSLYMGRWWLFNPYPKKKVRWQFPISIRIHHICRADSDRHLHDHPWNARTIILKGWYEEERLDGSKYFRNAGDTATLKFGEYHRINEVSEGGVWTMFITGKYRGTWGFMVNDTKIPYKEYLAEGPTQ